MQQNSLPRDMRAEAVSLQHDSYVVRQPGPLGTFQHAMVPRERQLCTVQKVQVLLFRAVARRTAGQAYECTVRVQGRLDSAAVQRSQSEPFGLEPTQPPTADGSRPTAAEVEPATSKLSGILSFLDEVSHEVRGTCARGC